MENPHWLQYIQVFLGPIIGAIIAIYLARLGKKIDEKQWVGRKVVEKRLDFYDEVGPKLNDLFCYYHKFGNWKELKPTDIIATKRFLDKQFHIYSHIFKGNILDAYRKFTDNCFKTFNEFGEDAKLKMHLEKRTKLKDWNPDWNKLFAPDEIVDKKVFDDSYNALLASIKKELEI